MRRVRPRTPAHSRGERPRPTSRKPPREALAGAAIRAGHVRQEQARIVGPVGGRATRVISEPRASRRTRAERRAAERPRTSRCWSPLPRQRHDISSGAIRPDQSGASQRQDAQAPETAPARRATVGQHPGSRRASGGRRAWTQSATVGQPASTHSTGGRRLSATAKRVAMSCSRLPACRAGEERAQRMWPT